MRLRVLSPLHIGNGNALTPIGFYPDGDTLRILDIEKLLIDLRELDVELAEILSLLENPPGDSFVWKGYIEELQLDPEKYTLYLLPIRGEPGKESMTVREFIKSGGKPYLPGSSLKGAIRTAVFYKVLRECGNASTAMRLVSRLSPNLSRSIGYSEDLVDFYIGYLSKELDKVGHARKKGRRYYFDPKRADDVLEAIVFGIEGSRGFPGIRYEPKRDPMRGLVIGDSAPIERKSLACYHVDVVGNTSSIPIWVEALEPETETEVEIVFDSKLLRINMGYFNGLLWECLKDRGEPWEVFEDFVWESVDEFYDALIDHELRFGKYGSPVRPFYEKLRAKDGHLLRIGWGGGWISTTIGLLLIEKGWKWEQVRKRLGLGRNPETGEVSKEFLKTRRLADGKPMGWVMLE